MDVGSRTGLVSDPNCGQRAAQEDGRRTASVLGSIVCSTQLTSSFKLLSAYTRALGWNRSSPAVGNRDPGPADIPRDVQRSAPSAPRYRSQPDAGVRWGVPKVSVYLPDELYREAKTRQLPLSSLVQEAVERALRNFERQEWVLRLRSRPRRHEGVIDTALLLFSVREDFGG